MGHGAMKFNSSRDDRGSHLFFPDRVWLLQLQRVYDGERLREVASLLCLASLVSAASESEFRPLGASRRKWKRLFGGQNVKILTVRQPPLVNYPWPGLCSPNTVADLEMSLQ